MRVFNAEGIRSNPVFLNILCQSGSETLFLFLPAQGTLSYAQPDRRFLLLQQLFLILLSALKFFPNVSPLSFSVPLTAIRSSSASTSDR